MSNTKKYIEGFTRQLSEALKADATAAGVIEPWQKTKAKVLVIPEMKVRRLAA